MIKRVRIKEFEKGLLFRHGEFIQLLDKGIYWLNMLNRKIDVVSTRGIYLDHSEADIIARSGLLKDEAVILDLTDNQRALVWKDGRFDGILSAGIHVLWQKPNTVTVETVETDSVQFQHRKLQTILNRAGVHHHLDMVTVENGFTGLFFMKGELVEQLKPGVYAFWKNTGKYDIYHFDTREKVLDIVGQDIITSDKVTLRLNTVISFKITDAYKAATSAEDVNHSLYRVAQLALRGVIGTHELDHILQEKDKVTAELEEIVKKKVVVYGLKVDSVGIRDVILPGEMKELLNKVTEARKAAEANIISRREETAAMRSQANTAKMLENNATLMRLKELETIERITANAKLNIILSDKSISGQFTNLF